jgi:hypothetical protein
MSCPDILLGADLPVGEGDLYSICPSISSLEVISSFIRSSSSSSSSLVSSSSPSSLSNSASAISWRKLSSVMVWNPPRSRLMRSIRLGRLALVFEEGRALREMAKSLGREPIFPPVFDILKCCVPSELFRGEGFQCGDWGWIFLA